MLPHEHLELVQGLIQERCDEEKALLCCTVKVSSNLDTALLRPPPPCLLYT